MRTFLFLFLISFYSANVFALDVFNLNVFDQLQGKWSVDFREKRMALVAKYVEEKHPDIVVFQEARGDKPGAEGGGTDSVDVEKLKTLYPYRRYVHEMTGADGASYGYWIGAKKEPTSWIEDGFSFPGGVARKVLAGVWEKSLGGGCVGVLSLHLSYQNSEVRQLEAKWILDWLKAHESQCKQWLVVGDFNADNKTKEMDILFSGGAKSLFKEMKPTVGAFNPIRRIYGENIPSLTIDWALGWNVGGTATVVLDKPFHGEWVSDHAGVAIQVKK